MKKRLAKLARRVAPRTMSTLQALSVMEADYGTNAARFIAYERELQGLRREIDELRRNQRRINELYDIVFTRARADAAARGLAPSVDPAVTTAALARLENSAAGAPVGAGTSGAAS